MAGFATREQRVQAIQKFDAGMLVDAYTVHVALLEDDTFAEEDARVEYEFNRTILRAEILRRLEMLEGKEE